MELSILTTLLKHDSIGWIGWLVVIAVVLGFGIGMLTKSMTTIVKNIKDLKKELEKPDYKKQIKCENNITKVMRSLRHELFADRVIVMQYHNGVYSIASNSLLKLSITHESLEKGVRSAMQNFQNIPSNYLGNWNKEIFDSRYITLPSINNEEDTSEQRGITQFLKEDGVQSMYMFPIEDSMGQTFGIGVVQYLRKECELTNKELQWARHRFHGIGALLAGPGEEA